MTTQENAFTPEQLAAMPSHIVDAIKKAQREKAAQDKKQQGYQDLRNSLKDVDVFAEFGEKAPLIVERPPSNKFPAHALGETLLGAAEGIMQQVPTCPPDIIYQSVLSAASIAVSGYANIITKNNRNTSLNDMFLTVGKSSAGKTASMNLAMVSVERYAETLTEKYRKWVKDKLDFEATRESSRQKYEVAAPWSGAFIQDDFTIEGVVKSLINQPMLALCNSDAATFLTGYSMKNNAVSTGATLSIMWDGGKITRNRASDEVVHILKNRRVSAHFMIQPQIADEHLFGLTSAKEQGFIARLLLMAPTEYPNWDSTRELDCNYQESNIKLTRFHEALYTILNSISYDESTFQIQLRSVTVCRDAMLLYLQYDNKCRALAEGDMIDMCESAYKMPQHALKLAGMIEIVNHPASLEVTYDSMKNALELCNFYLSEAKRLLGGQTAVDYKDAQKVWDWIDSRRHLIDDNGVFPQSKLYNGPECSRSAKNATKICTQLAQHGYLKRAPGKKKGWFVAD